jgi:hypothetical protein
MIKDIRDPSALGERLLHLAEAGLSLTTAMDMVICDSGVPYAGHLMGYYTAQEYRQELEAREDIYAKNTLERINGANS